MKTHYEIVVFEATESDPEEFTQIACGMQVVDKMTKYSDQVTCKKCLKVFSQRRRMLPEREQGYEDFLNHFEFDPQASTEWQDGWTYALYNNALATKAKKLATDYIEGNK